jgi:formylglycine-generating enzyme required for sulfatase activity
MMGSPTTEVGRHRDPFEVIKEETLHEVTLTKDFEIQQTEFTQEQWLMWMRNNPSQFKRKADCPTDHISKNEIEVCPRLPVENVRWIDVTAFLAKINQISEDYIYRLPTEAEWEYAARGGTQTAYSFGDSPENIGEYAWYEGNADRPQPVGTKKPNPFGLYDVHGNVWEWVYDGYGDFKSTPVVDPVVEGFRKRVNRGGAIGKKHHLRSAQRSYLPHDERREQIGFRLVREPK